MKLRQKIVFFNSVLCFFVLSYGSVCLAQVGGGLPSSISAPFLQRPVFAQFINSNLALRGDSSGLSVWDIEKNTAESTYLKDVAVSAMMANPHIEGQIAFATETGDVYLGTYTNNKFVFDKLHALTTSKLTVIKSILFHSIEKDRVLFADDRHVALCKFVNDQVVIERQVGVDDSNYSIVFAFPDNLSHDWFLVSGTQEHRFRGNWNSGELVSVPEDVLEYGFQVKKSGMSYFARGDNQEHLNIRLICARPTFMKQHPGDLNIYYAATIGASPLKISVNENNFYELQYLHESIHLTFSIDVDRNNPQHLLCTTTSAIQVSDDGGANWKSLR